MTPAAGDLLNPLAGSGAAGVGREEPVNVPVVQDPTGLQVQQHGAGVTTAGHPRLTPADHVGGLLSIHRAVNRLAVDVDGAEMLDECNTPLRPVDCLISVTGAAVLTEFDGADPAISGQAQRGIAAVVVLDLLANAGDAVLRFQTLQECLPVVRAPDRAALLGLAAAAGQD